MKKFFLLMLVALVVFSCKTQAPENEQTEDSVHVSVFPEVVKNMTIYEVNIRQYTPEGTIDAFAERLPHLKELGVDLLWIMPVQPISEKNRKGTLGSYYAVQNYTDINPEFGTLDDFKEMVSKAHDMGFYVILDWVPNHTGWDNPWITEHPEYYAQDSLGNVTYEADWTDIALLDHSNENLRKEMREKMEFWVRETNIDGFRCDHAGHEIPMLFWEETIPYLNSIKDLFWLAEWDETKMHSQFHSTYDWEMHHLTNAVAKGEQPADVLLDHAVKDIEKYGNKAFRMEFITNHDENSWGGTVFERYGDAHKVYAVFMFTAHGLPLIYSGQEAGLDKRLKFFEKDSIDWSDPKGMNAFYKSMVELRKSNPALWSGEYGGDLVVLKDDNEKVIAYSRIKEGNIVTVLLNTSGEDQEVTVHGLGEGSYTDFTGGGEFSAQGAINLPAYGYKILIQKDNN